MSGSIEGFKHITVGILVAREVGDVPLDSGGSVDCLGGAVGSVWVVVDGKDDRNSSWVLVCSDLVIKLH